MLRLAFLSLPATLLLLSARPVCAQEQPFATQTAAVAAAPHSEARPRLIVDGFAFAGQLEDLRPAFIKEISVLKGAESAAQAQRTYGPAANGFLFVSTTLPLHFGGKVLRTAAEKKAAAELTPREARGVRLVSALELKLSGQDSTMQVLKLAPPHEAVKLPAQNVTIRGITSITIGDEPLYVLDGFVLGAGSNVLQDLPPQDIAAINVLKHEQATQRYGEAGNYGVLELSTKVPLLVRGRLLRTAAEKEAALGGGSSRWVRTWRPLTSAELARHGLAPNAVALALTMDGKTLIQPLKQPKR